MYARCFEIQATYPIDSMVKVQIVDWDLIGSDDLIGETLIDLENRYYSRHRATCGIARRYDVYVVSNFGFIAESLVFSARCNIYIYIWLSLIHI